MTCIAWSIFRDAVHTEVGPALTRSVEQIYLALRKAYGPQSWWPGETQFEVMVGAVLTQNTAWRNVEKALANLVREKCLTPKQMLEITQAELAALIRPAGYFNLKAQRLRNLCSWLGENGGIDTIGRWETGILRDALLGINGVGPETADDILLYAFERDVFVVDTYTQRLFTRVGVIDDVLPYEILRKRVEAEVSGGALEYGQFHALIVEHAKASCRKNPLCDDCTLSSMCAFAPE